MSYALNLNKKRTALTGFLFLFAFLQSFAQNGPGQGKTRYREHYADGAKKTIGQLMNGKKTGRWLEYGQDGWLISKTKYKNDELKWVLLYKRGRIVESIDDKGNRKQRPHCGCN